MKKTFAFACIFSGLAMHFALAQPAPPPQIPVPSFSERVNRLKAQADQDAAALTPFNLDFPGGTPRQLADAIEKSMGKPVNVIIPDEYANTKLPPIKVSDVTLPQLFQSLLEGSFKRSLTGGVKSSYGFKTADGARQTDTAIWTFFVNTLGLTTFDIDFPGGTPKELVAAIQKATGKSLNVIVPPEFADTQLPALKMNDVTVNQLFHALESASAKVEAYNSYMGPGGFGSYQQKVTGYGFKTDGEITDDSIWYFHVDKVPAMAKEPPQKVSRFYALAPYLENGLKVDDITTAVETAWKMLGEKSPPEISFHKDTKLLIAVGDPEKLKTIDSVLQALKPDTSPNTVLKALMEKRESESKTNK
jgi:hypothetical protein